MLKSNTQSTIEIPEVTSQNFNTILLHFFDQCLDLRRHNLRLEAEVLVSRLAGQTLSESAHGEGCVGVSLPAIRCICLDDDCRLTSLGLEDRLLVFARLLLEQARYRERDNTCGKVELLLQNIAGLHRVHHLRASGDECDVKFLLLNKDICALCEALA